MYDYKSIEYVVLSPFGFTVVLKDTNARNDMGEEIIVVGSDLVNNNWSTDSRGFVFKCKNFTMS